MSFGIIYIPDGLARHLIDQSKYSTIDPSCEATPFASEKWTFKRGGLFLGVEWFGLIHYSAFSAAKAM